MSEELSIIMGMSCFVPAAIGLFYYKRMDKIFHPFVWMTVLTVISEMINYLSLVSKQVGKVQPIAINLYMLINFAVFLFLVFKSRNIKKQQGIFFLALAVLVAAINLGYNKTVFLPFFYLLCFVSGIMLFSSIDILSRQIFAIKGKVSDNFWFWFSGTSIIYNALNLLIFGAYVFTMFNTPAGKAIGSIQHFGNTACQLLFAVAMLKTHNQTKCLSK